ncbi:MAG: STAS domain-containing protein [Candidatus Omnitrophota bacterium]|nr:MAG: STAS domain-containing protein [Candidatus Omnitrophota bacterium]
MPLKVTVTQKEPDVYIVALSGSLDSQTYPDLENALRPILKPSTKAVVFDMEHLVYISSLGLSVIFRTKEALEEKGGTLAITNIQPKIKEVFDAVKAIPSQIFASMQEADEYLDAFLDDIEEEEKKE